MSPKGDADREQLWAALRALVDAALGAASGHASALEAFVDAWIAAVPDGKPDPARQIAAIAAMDGTVLPVQGPPGTGKTYVTARAILALVRQGHRVGVASNSHEAIRNVLMGCLAAQDDGDPVPGLCVGHKVSRSE